jgi:hypothetical protein
MSLFDCSLKLEDVLGCPVDLLERSAVESMKNPFKRRSMLCYAVSSFCMPPKTPESYLFDMLEAARKIED